MDRWLCREGRRRKTGMAPPLWNKGCRVALSAATQESGIGAFRLGKKHIAVNRIVSQNVIVFRDFFEVWMRFC